MGWLGIAVKVVLGLLALLLAVAGIAYAADYGLEATVKETHCMGTGNPFFPGTPEEGQSTVTVETKLLGIRHTSVIPRQACSIVREDNHVVYHVRSGHTILYEDASMANCIYDSRTVTGACA